MSLQEGMVFGIDRLQQEVETLKEFESPFLQGTSNSINTGSNTRLFFGAEILGAASNAARITLTGTASSSEFGPHYQVLGDEDIYPIFQFLGFAHDNVGFNFDSYFDSGWYSSASGANWQIYKNGDDLMFRHDSGVPAGSAISWNRHVVMRTNGIVSINGDFEDSFMGNGGLAISGQVGDGTDDRFVSLVNQSMAHGMTSVADTVVFGAFDKISSTQGGLDIVALTEGIVALDLSGYATSACDGESANVDAAVRIRVAKKSGTSSSDLGNDENTFVIRNNNKTRNIFKGDGEIWSDQTATVGVYDEYDDVSLARALDVQSPRPGFVSSPHDEFVKYTRDDLEQANLARFNDDGTVFMNISGLVRLHSGAIWQLHNRLANLEIAMDKENG